MVVFDYHEFGTPGSRIRGQQLACMHMKHGRIAGRLVNITHSSGFVKEIKSVIVLVIQTAMYAIQILY